MRVDAAGRRMTKGLRALLRIRDDRIATVRQIAQVAKFSLSTAKAIFSGEKSDLSVAEACRLKEKYGIPVEDWNEDEKCGSSNQSQDSGLDLPHAGFRR